VGDDALKATEKIAEEMLKMRRLIIPHNRVSISDTIKRKLCSLDIIREMQGNELTFGHQTLLDVLAISGAIRKGMTLNEFIQGLKNNAFEAFVCWPPLNIIHRAQARNSVPSE